MWCMTWRPREKWIATGCVVALAIVIFGLMWCNPWPAKAAIPLQEGSQIIACQYNAILVGDRPSWVVVSYIECRTDGMHVLHILTPDNVIRSDGQANLPPALEKALTEQVAQAPPRSIER